MEYDYFAHCGISLCIFFVWFLFCVSNLRGVGRGINFDDTIRLKSQ